MQDFQLRVIKEKEELDAKHEKLIGFLKSDSYLSLQTHDKRLLLEQSIFMGNYSRVLGERIERFKE